MTTSLLCADESRFRGSVAGRCQILLPVTQAETIVERLSRSDVLARSAEYPWFADVVDRQLRAIDLEVPVTGVSMRIRFVETPTAAALARSLDETDRQARRVVAAFERGVRPENLRGRGTRLVPPALGLVVERADPGSLDLLLGLGGLYQVVTSQPLSFALNLAALVGYGKAAVRAIDPRLPDKLSEINVHLPTLPHADHETYHPEGLTLARTTSARPPRGLAVARIPSDYTDVRIRVEYADGTSIDIECSK